VCSKRNALRGKNANNAPPRASIRDKESARFFLGGLRQNQNDFLTASGVKHPTVNSHSRFASETLGLIEALGTPIDPW
jgi:hypothetical protein